MSTIGLEGVFSLGGWSRRFHAGFLVPRATQGAGLLGRGFRVRGSHPLRPRVPSRSATPPSRSAGPTTPDAPGRTRFGLLPVRSPLLGESRLMSSPLVTWMFRFARLASTGLCIQPADTRIAPGGFSHSGSRGSMAFCASSRTCAACRALRRRRMPRHPPCAFYSLIPNSNDSLLR